MKWTFLKHVGFVNICICFISILGLACSCTRYAEYREIPVPTVHLKIYPFGMDNTLGPIGNYKIFPTYGYNGIIVYHLSSSEFLAYDLACPNDYEHGATVVYDHSNLTLTDHKNCGTVFSILNGFPTESGHYPSPLHQYNTIWDSRSEVLTVYN